MKQFVLIFRMDITSAGAQPSPEQMQRYMQQWMEWISEIAGKNQLADGGNHFSQNGKLIRPQNRITDGPYTAGKESVAGYILILAKDMDDAVCIAQQCPILNGEGTSVEVRATATPGEMDAVRRVTKNG